MSELTAHQYIQRLRKFLPPEVGVEVLGGMPLALYLNQPYKDIDVFITNMTLGTLDGMLLKEDKFSLCGVTLKSKSSFDYTCINKTTVLTCIIGGIDIDLIISPTPTNRECLMYSFDMSICQAWVDDIYSDVWEGKVSEWAKKLLILRLLNIYKNSQQISYLEHIETEKRE